VPNARQRFGDFVGWHVMIPLLPLGMLLVRGELEPKPEDLQLAEAPGFRVAEITVKVRGQ